MCIRKGRKMLCWSHYKFRQRLQLIAMAKSELFNDCNVIECNESYTSKTCKYCRVINSKLGSSSVFIPKQNQRQQKFINSA
eukprot:Pgem_evm1s6799